MLQKKLEELLQKKGIGPEGSKSLSADELTRVEFLFHSQEVSLTTKATMLTALLILDPTPAEKTVVDKIIANPSLLPSPLDQYIVQSDNEFLNLIKKIIRKEDLSEKESGYCMEQLFMKDVPDYLKASFLEGERLKRESFQENSVFLNHMYKKCTRIQTDLPLLLDIGDNYDGFNRSFNLSVFAAATIAAAGFPVLIHGLEKVAPKFGVTTHQLLNEAQKNPFISLTSAVEQLNNREIGWAYIDQSIYFPELYRLHTMRKEMVKRPFLATFEKLLQPIRAKEGNYLITGYTHPHYKQEVINQLKEHKACRKAMVFKGMEGSTPLSLSKSTTAMFYDGTSILERSVHPSDYQLPELEHRPDRTLVASDSLSEGFKALKGEKNYARESILLQASGILHGFGLLSPDEAINILSELLDSGKALKHWEKANL